MEGKISDFNEISQAESKIENLESELEECRRKHSGGESKIGELEKKVKDLQSEATKNQEALQETKIGKKKAKNDWL